MRTDRDGRGMVNILAADKLMQTPRLYATFLLWLLSELFEEMPEVGDPEKPKLVFFFDEAHLLFTDAPKPLMDKIEQVVRLVRSKGVGVYFVTQNPLDVPETVLGAIEQPGPACAASLHAARSESGQDGGRDVPAQSQARYIARSSWNWEKAKRWSRSWKAMARPHGGPHHDLSAVGAAGNRHAGRTQGDHGQQSGQGQIRYLDRFRIRL